MVGVHAERAHDTPGSLSKAEKLGIHINPRVATTPDGYRTVVLNGRTIELYDTSGTERKLVSERTINDLKENIGNGPWLKVQPNEGNEIALSSDGRLLAIAQERTIQIYDLLDTPDSFSVNEYVSSATGNYICGLDFEQDNYLLRVRLSGKGTVLYLGSPPSLARGGQPATMSHWKSKSGLCNTFLDSALLSLPTGSTDFDPTLTSRICGVQLLRPFDSYSRDPSSEGYLFAGQLHGNASSSLYILFHLSSTTSNPPSCLPSSFTLLTRLESFLSLWPYTSAISSADHDAMGSWENMPSAHEHHPRFAVEFAAANGDNEGGWLVLAEKDKKRIRPQALSQVFLYRVPGMRELRETIVDAEKESRQEDGGEEISPMMQKQRSRHVVPRRPICLSTVQGEITRLSVEANGEKAVVVASTAETTRSWRLEEF
jgi:hypothetical protein